MYTISHTSSEHIFKQVSFVVPAVSPAGNLATIEDITHEKEEKNNTTSKNNNTKKKQTKNNDDATDNVDDLQFKEAWMVEDCNDDSINVVAVATTWIKTPYYLLNLSCLL